MNKKKLTVKPVNSSLTWQSGDLIFCVISHLDTSIKVPASFMQIVAFFHFLLSQRSSQKAQSHTVFVNKNYSLEYTKVELATYLTGLLCFSSD